MHADDTQLIARIRGGDRAAATTLVDRHYAAVYAFLRRLSGSEADAADLTQRAFVRAWQAIDRFAGRSSVASWVHGIARHVWLDWLRRNHRETHPGDAWWEAQPDGADRPDARVAQDDLAAAVYAAVDGLPEDLRVTVHLHYYQELSLQETALALEIAASTVKHRLRAAVQQLRSLLAEPLSNPSRTSHPIPR
ncbi:MAG: RNA polymerase sigma factor [Verrucomicrobiales bacterium]|nr:RNA polymerase sigma factor [Verrucomicrobiales bacterium]MCP5525768.1 RNA polymerase sigma factor [Verrucomicrobiales bacterium]